jgi:hypothetical protein
MGKQKMSYKKLRKAAKKLYGGYPILDTDDGYSKKYRDLMISLGLASSRNASNQVYPDSLIRTDKIGGYNYQTQPNRYDHKSYTAPLPQTPIGYVKAPMGTPEVEPNPRYDYNPVAQYDHAETNVMPSVSYNELMNLTQYIRFKYTPDVYEVVARMTLAKELSLYVPDVTLSTKICKTDLSPENCEKGFLDPLYGAPMELISRIELSRSPISRLSHDVYNAYLTLLDDIYAYLLNGMEEDEEYSEFLDRACDVLNAFLVDYGELKYYAMTETFQNPGRPIGNTQTVELTSVQTPRNDLSGFYMSNTSHEGNNEILHVYVSNQTLHCAVLNRDGEHDYPEQEYFPLEVSQEYSYNTKLLGVSVYDFAALCRILYEVIEREHSCEMKRILPGAWDYFHNTGAAEPKLVESEEVPVVDIPSEIPNQAAESVTEETSEAETTN